MPNTGKYGPEITPYLDTFHAVSVSNIHMFHLNDFVSLQQLLERGEKLNALSERTEEMNLKANKLASASKALAEKYKKQKWYQFQGTCC